MALNLPDTEAAAFIGKWRERWPEWGIAQVFLAPGQRELAETWFAMLQEWTDAATTEEPAPGLAKLAWWQDELRGWAKGARRHPLGQRLHKHRLDWSALADALPALMRREGGFDAAALDRLAAALAEAERGLFEEDRDGHAGIGHALRSALGEALAHLPRIDGTRPRRLIEALRVGRPEGRPLSPWATLRSSWRAARAGPTV